MTTIFGLKHPQVNLAILAADMQTTSLGSENQAPTKYLEGRKLWLANNEMYAFGHSGLRDDALNALAESMKSGNIDIEKVLTEGKFPQLREFNLSRLGDKIPDLNKLSSFLIISRYKNNPALHTCFPLGAVEPRTWTQIGSGGDRVEEYMNSLIVMSNARTYLNTTNPVNRDDIVRVGLEAIRYAQGIDIYSSGIDMIALTPDSSIDCFKLLQEDFDKKIQSVQDRIKAAK